MKPNYEKPMAMPSGEAAKGSGQCNAGSTVEGVGLSPTSDQCATGPAVPDFYCKGGSML